VEKEGHFAHQHMPDNPTQSPKQKP
jgi:hypothetical protein